jgi:hypothetical protein
MSAPVVRPRLCSALVQVLLAAALSCCVSKPPDSVSDSSVYAEGDSLRRYAEAQSPQLSSGESRTGSPRQPSDRPHCRHDKGGARVARLKNLTERGLTPRQLRDVLMSLIIEKGNERVSVRDITARGWSLLRRRYALSSSQYCACVTKARPREHIRPAPVSSWSA